MFRKTIYCLIILFLVACGDKSQKTVQPDLPFIWENATVYFLMTDRFNNGDTTNDFKHPAGQDPAPYRGFMGGDIKGVTAKIKEGYFDSLGVNAIWTTPVVENVDGSVDEGTGRSYGFHGYWTKDWTMIDPRLGTAADFKEMVNEAHKHNIKIIVDVVLNHTGPVTELDQQWPKEWVRTTPQCVYKDMNSTISCTLVKNLPDIRTEDDSTAVMLPEFLVKKWQNEGRYDQEIAELDAFFAKTGYTRSSQNYIIKWLIDFIKEYGVDGFRVDTAKHVEGYVWQKLWDQAKAAFEEHKKNNATSFKDDLEFYMVGEVYNYGLANGPLYDYGDRKVNFYESGFNSMINFDFKYDAIMSYSSMHEKYDSILSTPGMQGKWLLNYLSSHDDGAPFDPKREKTFESANRLLLNRGAAQIYYGEETARSLTVKAEGDAVLRSYMNWEDLNKAETQDLYKHFQKLGTFRQKHPSVGAGKHTTLKVLPYTFSRSWTNGSLKDAVVVCLGCSKGPKSIDVSSTFTDGMEVTDHYSGLTGTVKKGSVTIDSPFEMVLLSL
ncbi:MAG: hypothetical protein KA767_07195 [Saprospiraceae bacterium]|nr:hypothetical protein [Saprospiraceae bacterium]